MDYALIAIAVSATLTVASALFSKKYYSLKTRVKALTELLDMTDKAMEDDTLTEEELQKITNLVKQVLGRG